MPDPVHVILNPASSSGAAGRLGPKIEEELRRRDIPYRLESTAGPGHAESLARSARDQGIKRILAVGGDGTVHEIANGLLADGQESESALAVLPVGTGNDFYRMVGAPSGVEAAVAVLENGVPRRFDVGVARWQDGQKYFVNLMGLGVDVEVIRQREGVRRLSGLAQYLAALVLALVRFRPVPIRVQVEEEAPFEEPSYLCIVTVGPSAGGGFMLSPGASPLDGLLDLCFVGDVGYLRLVRYIPRVIRGTHGDLEEVHLRRLRRIRLESPDGTPFRFQLDGELIASATPWLEGEVAPGRLTVLVPEGVR